jgi:predicted nucleic acid-binding protein
MTEGLLDTSVVIDLRRYVDRVDLLPDQAYVSTLTLAEIVQGPLFARTDADRRSRDRVVLDAHRAFPEPIAFDAACVPAYRSIAALTIDAGRKPRRRTLDLLIAATAQAHGLALYTKNAGDIEHLTELLVYDRNRHPSRYSVVLVSEGAVMEDAEGPVFEGEETDMYGHRKLGGIGDRVSAELKDRSARFNSGHRVNVVNQRLGYLVRSGDPDAMDSIVPMAFGNLALDLVLAGKSGRLISVRNGSYDNEPIDVVVNRKKVVDVHRHYSTERLRPLYHTLMRQPVLIMKSDV